ncbi:Centromere/kinetochore protein zw10 [Podospora conica]|nr:Centromere/kinetochore protein zw10 [Schizothecium conicum]
MAATDHDPESARLAKALVAFSVDGTFPEEGVSTLVVDPSTLPAAIQALGQAKAALQSEVHAINQETADDVRAWKANAQSVQDDVLRSKSLANEILRKAETPQASGKAIREAEARAEFLARELNYNRQVQDALRGIKAVSNTLDMVEQARDERRILDALHLLEKSWTQMDSIPINKSCRAIRLLDIRAFELKSDVHEVFDRVWSTLVNVDVEHQRISISSSRQDEPMNLSDAVVGLKAYKEVDQRSKQLWQDVDRAVLIPRMEISQTSLPAIHVDGDVLEIRGSADRSVDSLFVDLAKVFSFLVQRLPTDLVDTVSSTLLPEVVHRVTKVWLDSFVPASLQDMEKFQNVIASAKEFCDTLKSLGFSNYGDLQDWTDNAPRVWLSKCREAALDSVRAKLSQGLGASTVVERVEKQMVSRSEGLQLAANGATADDEDHGWGAWDDGEEEPPQPAEEAKPEVSTTGDEDEGADAWGWGEEDANQDEKPQTADDTKPDEDEDPTAAWGWGEDADNVDAEDIEGPVDTKPLPQPRASAPEPREITFRETYNISSMPQPVLDLIFAIVEDGAALTKDTYATSPVAAAAAGLFNLPTIALAMFRAVSPFYYTSDLGGNMYLYNDAIYLAERLADFATAWKKRDDITTRAQNMLRLDGDIQTLQSFATRAYSKEMNLQKTVLRDLLGGDHSLMHQDEPESCISLAVARVRSMAITWENILSRSAWHQAIGALADAVASKIIADVIDMSSIGQDEAYNIASWISSVTALDDLFLPKHSSSGLQGKPSANKAEADQVPITAQYAPSWLRLKYLSEVLQSNLKDVRYLWVESELSLYFTIDEVVELINMSFEDNPRTREVLREITQNPSPLGHN